MRLFAGGAPGTAGGWLMKACALARHFVASAAPNVVPSDRQPAPKQQTRRTNSAKRTRRPFPARGGSTRSATETVWDSGGRTRTTDLRDVSQSTRSVDRNAL